MPRLPIGSLLRYHASRKPADAVAVAQGALRDRSTATWAELDLASNRRASWLRQAGVQHDDLVTVALSNSIAFFETTFAIWKLGATPNIVSPRLPLPELHAIVETAKPRVIISDGGPNLPGWPQLSSRDSLLGCNDDPIDAFPATFLKAMTSGGSTGRPKVIVDHTPGTWDPEQPVIMQPKDGVVLNPGPLYHNAPFLFSHAALFAGSRVTSMDRFDAEEALRLIEHDHVGWVNFVPTMMKRIIALPEATRKSYDLSSLSAVWHMAAAISPEVKRRWIDWLGANRIFEAYSATEAVGGSVITGAQWLSKPGSVGLPMGNCRLKVVDKDGRVADPGEVGEIFMMPQDGPGSTYHYLGDGPNADAGGWESVGDMGWMDEDGFLYLADRRSDLIVRGGANIYPAEIEHILERHPEVVTAVVIGLSDEDLGQRVHAIIERREGTSLAEHDLVDLVVTNLARYKHPASYEFVTRPLRDEAGKIRRSALISDRAEIARA